VREEGARTSGQVLSELPPPPPHQDDVPQGLVLKSATTLAGFKPSPDELLGDRHSLEIRPLSEQTTCSLMSPMFDTAFFLNILTLVSYKFICCKLYSHNGCALTDFFFVGLFGTEWTCWAFIWQNFHCTAINICFIGVKKFLTAINNGTATSTGCAYKPEKILMAVFLCVLSKRLRHREEHELLLSSTTGAALPLLAEVRNQL